MYEFIVFAWSTVRVHRLVSRITCRWQFRPFQGLSVNWYCVLYLCIWSCSSTLCWCAVLGCVQHDVTAAVRVGPSDARHATWWQRLPEVLHVSDVTLRQSVFCNDCLYNKMLQMLRKQITRRWIANVMSTSCVQVPTCTLLLCMRVLHKFAAISRRAITTVIVTPRVKSRACVPCAPLVRMTLTFAATSRPSPTSNTWIGSSRKTSVDLESCSGDLGSKSSVDLVFGWSERGSAVIRSVF